MYINNQQIYSSNGLNAHKSHISNNFNGAIFEYQGLLHFEGYAYEEFSDKVMKALLSETFSTRTMKMLSRPDGFMLYGKLGVESFSNSEMLYPKLMVGLRLLRVRPNFYMSSDESILTVAIADCSLYTRRIALRDVYHQKRLDMLAYNPLEYNYLESFTKSFIIPARQNQFIQESLFNNAPVRRIAIAMNTNSAFTGSYTKNLFWCQQFVLRQK